jgi:hypothetical protein
LGLRLAGGGSGQAGAWWACRQGGANEVASAAEQLPGREIDAEGSRGGGGINQEHGAQPWLANRLGAIAMMSMMAAKAAPSSTWVA